MKTIRNWNDMEQYGITCLTGEACAYGYRLLCDVSMAGYALIQECLGLRRLPVDTLTDAWNRGSGSIMLAHAMLEPLAVFALFQAGCVKVYITYAGEVHGIQPDDDPARVQAWVDFNQGAFCDACGRYGAGGGVNRSYANPGHSRNQHHMSGRTS